MQANCLSRTRWTEDQYTLLPGTLLRYKIIGLQCFDFKIQQFAALVHVEPYGLFIKSLNTTHLYTSTVIKFYGYKTAKTKSMVLSEPRSES